MNMHYPRAHVDHHSYEAWLAAYRYQSPQASQNNAPFPIQMKYPDVSWQTSLGPTVLILCILASTFWVGYVNPGLNSLADRKPLTTVVQAGGVLVLLSLAVNTIGISPDIALLDVNYIHRLLVSLSCVLLWNYYSSASSRLSDGNDQTEEGIADQSVEPKKASSSSRSKDTSSRVGGKLVAVTTETKLSQQLDPWGKTHPSAQLSSSRNRPQIWPFPIGFDKARPAGDQKLWWESGVPSAPGYLPGCSEVSELQAAEPGQPNVDVATTALGSSPLPSKKETLGGEDTNGVKTHKRDREKLKALYTKLKSQPDNNPETLSKIRSLLSDSSSKISDKRKDLETNLPDVLHSEGASNKFPGDITSMAHTDQLEHEKPRTRLKGERSTISRSDTVSPDISNARARDNRLDPDYVRARSNRIAARQNNLKHMQMAVGVAGISVLNSTIGLLCGIALMIYLLEAAVRLPEKVSRSKRTSMSTAGNEAASSTASSRNPSNSTDRRKTLNNDEKAALPTGTKKAKAKPNELQTLPPVSMIYMSTPDAKMPHLWQGPEFPLAVRGSTSALLSSTATP